jgi:hypothetical protein
VTGGAHHATSLGDRLALIVCNVSAHLRPVFHAVASFCGLVIYLSDALAKIIWRAQATILFVQSMSTESMSDAALFAL